MSAVKIIPCLDIRNGRVVKGKKFENIVEVDYPKVLAKQYSESGADELAFFDIDASYEGRQTMLECVREVAESIDIPFCVGGGVAKISDFTEILSSGADKVAVNSAALRNPGLIREAALKYGSDRVVLAIDAKRDADNSWSVYVKGGKERINLDPVEWAVKAAGLGAGEIVVNSIDEDGMKKGYDIELLRRIKASVNVPIIASGGAGKPEHFYNAIKYANVDGVLAASVFHYGEIKIGDLKKYLRDRNVEVRMRSGGDGSFCFSEV